MKMVFILKMDKKGSKSVTVELLMYGSISIVQPVILVKRDIERLWEFLW
jgi:hypothetical protein